MNLQLETPTKPAIRWRKIYVASSWRNPHQAAVVAALVDAGHMVYDFKNPRPDNKGFAWSEIDPNWMNWTAEEYAAALDHPIAKAGYASDMNAMKWADTFLLVLPCGRSAHLELGWACGQGKQTLVLTCDGQEPELMAKMCDHICTSLQEAMDILAG
jgi:nucleoside 2-deoxyribosyltransferase